jgi:hypothetical protein
VEFRLGAVRLKRDRTAPFTVEGEVPDFAPPGEAYALNAHVAIILRGGQTAGKVVTAKLKTCS